ncbi:MAG: tRNA epoxyqueuosine(34) reductase QueG, partial [Planctomycetota bacterium]
MPPPTPAQIRQAASELGFSLCGITRAVSSPGHSRLVDWIAAGYAADMNYFQDRVEAYRHPNSVLPGVQSIIALAFPYPAEVAPELSNHHGRVARYAWQGSDYHDVIHPKLKTLCRWIDTESSDGQSSAGRSRGVVDTAPLLEREVAQLAGLGWRGKNTLVIRPGMGSYFFLAFVLTGATLDVDTPFETYHCGTCTACLDACPTKAFPEPGVMDASKCISYLTIEHRGPIPIEFRHSMGDWLFGCDVCQEVCPWNRKPSRDETSRSTSLGPTRTRSTPRQSTP